MSPLNRALMLEAGSVRGLWAAYAGRFAFDDPATLLP